MCEKAKDICHDHGFCFLDHVERPALQLDAVGRQCRSDRTYYWNNKNRQACFLFQYTLRGSGMLETAEGAVTVKKEEAFFLQMPGNEAYYFDEERCQAPWEFIYIMFSGRCVLSYYDHIISRRGVVMPLPDHHPAVRKLLELYLYAEKGLLQNAFMAERETFSFLCALCEPDASGGRSSSLTDRAKAYMEQNFDKPVTLSGTAESLGVSGSHLSREFVKYTGEPPIRYLTKVRLEHAVKLLHSTDMKLEEISACCGFSDSNYFSKVFKKYMKASPGEMRRQMRAQGYVSVKV